MSSAYVIVAPWTVGLRKKDSSSRVKFPRIIPLTGSRDSCAFIDCEHAATRTCDAMAVFINPVEMLHTRIPLLRVSLSIDERI